MKLWDCAKRGKPTRWLNAATTRYVSSSLVELHSMTHVVIVRYVVNPSGGLEAKGHPLGATGLGMHFYIASQSAALSPPKLLAGRRD